MRKMKQIQITDKAFKTLAKDIGLSFSETFIMRMMTTFIDDKYRGPEYVAVVSYKEICDCTGFGQSTVSKVIRKLKETGYITVKRTNDCNIYTINVPLILEKHKLWKEYVKEHYPEILK